MKEGMTLNLHGTSIGADLYMPMNPQHSVPAVVMAPGFGGVKEMLIPAYAKALASIGIAVLAVDYPNFGESGGEPRQFVDIKAQLATYTLALDCLQHCECIDADRLGVWGSSLSGGHALVIAARDRRVKSAMAIIPFIATQLKMAPGFAKITTLDLLSRFVGGKGQTIKIAGRPYEQAAMNTDGAWEWMQKMTADAPDFKNEVAVKSFLQMANYRTAKAAKSIRVPLKVLLATEDSITPAKMVRKALSSVPGVVIEEYPETHFELFDRYLDATVNSTVEWFEETLMQQNT
ncbi:MAG: alpha/beta fold hydrolase [Ketobacter sp.]|nr:MAG: alpha/beta hydrolase [Ketobacter sp.]